MFGAAIGRRSDSGQTGCVKRALPSPDDRHWEDCSPPTPEELTLPDKPVEHRFSSQDMLDAFEAGWVREVEFSTFVEELLQKRTRRKAKRE